MLSRLCTGTPSNSGLIRESEGLRAYGAGILSSSGELPVLRAKPRAATPAAAVGAHHAHRYKIDTFQQTYFVIDGFQQLFDMTAADFSPITRR